MKTLFTISALLLATMNVFSQESTYSNYTGNWTTNGSWTDGTAPASLNLPITNGDITMNGYINLGTAPAPAPGSGDILTFSANKEAYDFIINDTLVVYGDVFFANKAMNLVINSGGFMIVLGNMELSNKIVLASDGNLIISGTFNKTGSQGSYTGTGNVYAGNYTGDASDLVPDASEMNAGSDLQNDFPDIYDFIQGGGSTPLPVSLLSFDARVINHSVELVWSTASEENNDYFTIEKSHNGIDYEEVATIGGAGSHTGVLNYSYSDNAPIRGRSYYRLSQTDFDGTTAYFDVVTVDYTTIKGLSVYPNPVNVSNMLTIQTGADADEDIEIAIYSNAGQLVKSEVVSGNGAVTIQNDLKAGFYMLQVKSGQVIISTRLVVQ
ncbi:T9SS type A sorting domain-containing protein [Fulvivirga ulvae]|uniref:T9SS type A sorting domain-containing protein n=1 Tax=Fulvivirga ulvae TaxID=2904245 RepID=UPI001F3353AC|nr:T9SS type A sorting domain-containing protein [Fulvivirga ulvae]UII33315.1 T9SS type A sorting domain-containing protein [Fulvivirga ulvae]